MESEVDHTYVKPTLFRRLRAYVPAIKSEHVVIGIVSLFLLSFVAYPCWMILRKSIMGKTGGLTLAHIREAIGARDMLLQPLLNSLSISFFVTLLSLMIALPLGYLVAKTDLPWKKAVATAMIVPYIIPSYSLCMAWVLLFSRAGILEYFLGTPLHVNVYGYWPIVMTQTVHLYPLAFILIANTFAEINQEFFDAGKIHGGKKFYVLSRITIPILLPGILSGAVLVFAYAMAEFAPAMLLGGPKGLQVLTTQIWSYATVFPTDVPLAAVLSDILVLCTLVFLLINHAFLSKRRFTTVTGKASRLEVISLGKWKSVLSSVCYLFLFLVIVVPLITLFLGATTNIWGKGYSVANFTLHHFKTVLLEEETYRRSIVNVILLGIGSGFISVILGIAISYFIIRAGGITSKFLNLTAFIPFVIPGIVIGVGLILAFTRPPLALYGTLWILLVGYVIRFLPIATSSGTAAFKQLDEELEEAGRIFGASWFKTQRKILYPLLKSTIIGAWLLVFVSVMKEVSTPAIIWSPGTEVAPIMALIQFSDGYFSQSVALSFVLVVIVCIGTGLAVRFGAVKFVKI